MSNSPLPNPPAALNNLDPYMQDATATDLYNCATNVEHSEESWDSAAAGPLLLQVAFESGQAANSIWAGVLDGVTMVQRLGSGGFGSTFQVEWQNTQKALKVCVNLETCREGWASEVAVLRRLRGVPGVAQLHWAGYSPKYLFLLLDLGDMGSLAGRMPGGVGLIETLRLGRELCAILAIVHGRDVLHLDLKAANVVLRSDQEGVVHPVIIDWGLSMFVQDGRCEFRPESTPGYKAPEQRDWRSKLGITAAVDMWTVILLIVELMEGSYVTDVAWDAHEEYDPEELNAVDADNLPVLGPVRGWFRTGAWKGNTGASLQSAVMGWLCPNPTHRPSAAQVASALGYWEVDLRIMSTEAVVASQNDAQTLAPPQLPVQGGDFAPGPGREAVEGPYVGRNSGGNAVAPDCVAYPSSGGHRNAAVPVVRAPTQVQRRARQYTPYYRKLRSRRYLARYPAQHREPSPPPANGDNPIAQHAPAPPDSPSPTTSDGNRPSRGIPWSRLPLPAGFFDPAYAGRQWAMPVDFQQYQLLLPPAK
ncbi:hypothetical protein CspHIS471_0100630 [Cutaneotrichosporon sp. HIS471]|nr:hypothetical protein CspHIS471_0100630 [Cutaneotrichosporon sp. HIS471]